MVLANNTGHGEKCFRQISIICNLIQMTLQTVVCETVKLLIFKEYL